MNSFLQKIIESKRALRRELAAQSIAEKLRMLDELRTRVPVKPARTRPRQHAR